MINKIKILLLLISISVVSGCASIKKAPVEMDAKAKQFMTVPDKAAVYVYRNETFGAALSMPVTVDGQLAGNTGPESFFRFELAPGSHTITSQGDGSELTVQTEAGKIYYVWQEVKMGMWSGGSKLQLVDDKTGMKGVNECTMIQSRF